MQALLLAACPGKEFMSKAAESITDHHLSTGKKCGSLSSVSGCNWFLWLTFQLLIHSCHFVFVLFFFFVIGSVIVCTCLFHLCLPCCLSLSTGTWRLKTLLFSVFFLFLDPPCVQGPATIDRWQQLWEECTKCKFQTYHRTDWCYCTSISTAKSSSLLHMMLKPMFRPLSDTTNSHRPDSVLFCQGKSFGNLCHSLDHSPGQALWKRQVISSMATSAVIHTLQSCSPAQPSECVEYVKRFPTGECGGWKQGRWPSPWSNIFLPIGTPKHTSMIIILAPPNHTKHTCCDYFFLQNMHFDHIFTHEKLLFF